MIDLSSPEPREGDLARCYVIHQQDLCIISEADGWQWPRLPLQAPRHHPHYHFLGMLGSEPCYVCELSSHELDEQPLQRVPLRRLVGAFDENEFAMASRALQFLSWQANHRFCSRCGQATETHGRELAMVCPACDYRQYPRITPCIITLVTRGDHALLGRSARFPEGMYSCLAGFMEAGENAEQALVREVMEEVGVQVQNVRYFSSQSWPFPHSLMLGFHADYADGDIRIDDDEIVAADWFRFDQLPMVPPPGSIARSLIDHWVAGCQQG
ncbi:NADH pyrophosphatase [Alcanivorax hongdengensis A-11-3]|uniref:NAD(+) diphosphatase n=1 Tax=Alcanivorax hongdengensis A-11-3 TaxID=1177179 RepID=L0WD59_9GAMM|nr:NAD(+) diphosphatase [Alcanivorax hongdengensis]EKF74906.1 NADH pyrophosphatase [Alcanivorax hongdengensis A-11-3]